MSGHKKKWHRWGKPDPVQEFKVVCACGWRSSATSNRQAIEDEIRDHDRKIDRLRASLGGQPTLKSQRDYFTAQAEDPANPDKDRRLWKQLADEVDRRLNDHADPHQDQSSLW